VASAKTGQWFYREEGRRVGPVSLDGLVERLRTLQEPDERLVWRHGLDGWVPADDLPEVAARLAAAPGGGSKQDALGEAAAEELAALLGAEEPAADAEAPPLEGDFSEYDFPDLVQALYQRRWTGSVKAQRGSVAKAVQVREGRLVFATSTSPDDRLGELLLRNGRITLRQYLEAGQAVQQGRRLGAVLVERGALQAEEIVPFVTEHTREVIYGLFLWTEGRYQLDEGLDRQETITLRINTPELILQGIKRIQDWSRIRDGVGGIDALYERAPDWEEQIRQMALSDDERALVSGHADVLDVAARCEGSPLPDFEACRVLWAFRVVGALRHVPPEPAGSA
jgi:Domain of unknown function (DUF4388)/GYF domain 2